MRPLIFSLLLFSSVCFGKELRRPVAVLDTGVNRYMAKQPYMCEDGVTNTVGYTEYDLHGHGSNIIGIIAKNMDYEHYCILSIKVFHHYSRKGHQFVKFDIVNGLKIALNRGAKFINMSLYGPESDQYEKALMIKAIQKGARITIAAGNKNRNLDTYCDSYPACYRLKGVHVVGNGKSYHNRNNESNYSTSLITDWRDGKDISAGGTTLSGTSQSAAVLMAEFVRKPFTRPTKRSNMNKRGNFHAIIQKQTSNLLRRRRYDNSMAGQWPSRGESNNRREWQSFRGSGAPKTLRQPKKALAERPSNRGMVRWGW